MYAPHPMSQEYMEISLTREIRQQSGVGRGGGVEVEVKQRYSRNYNYNALPCHTQRLRQPQINALKLDLYATRRMKKVNP